MNFGLLVSPAQVERVWPLAEPYLLRVNNYRSTLEDIYPLLVSGDRQLWVCITDAQIVGACITQIADHAQTRTFIIHTMGGDGGDWDAMIQDVEDFARAHGCSHVEVCGRAGWARKLSGFTELYRTFTKRLD